MFHVLHGSANRDAILHHLPHNNSDARLRAVKTLESAEVGQTEPVNSAAPVRGLRPGALLISGAINLLGALLVILVMPAHASDDRVASAWALVQFLSGVWAGVLGANTPFLHGLVAGSPALLLGLVLPSPLPAQFVVMAWFLAPAAALIAAALMRFMRRRAP
jgi:hypothetical protein